MRSVYPKGEDASIKLPSLWFITINTCQGKLLDQCCWKSHAICVIQDGQQLNRFWMLPLLLPYYDRCVPLLQCFLCSFGTSHTSSQWDYATFHYIIITDLESNLLIRSETHVVEKFLAYVSAIFAGFMSSFRHVYMQISKTHRSNWFILYWIFYSNYTPCMSCLHLTHMYK